MKKILVTICLLFSCMAANADMGYDSDYTNVNMVNFWDKNGKSVQKVTEVGAKIINGNKLDKRIPFMVKNSSSYVNAFAMLNPKLVVVSTGILPYIDNDDELAFIMSHEIAHSLDAYEGCLNLISSKFNSKSYEYKADLIGVDLMVNAGYNPIAAITEMNKWFPEPFLDFGMFTSHPKASKRMFEIYKYIYKKYPWALDSDMTRNLNYQNFTYSAEKELTQFKQEEKARESARKKKYSI